MTQMSSALKLLVFLVVAVPQARVESPEAVYDRAVSDFERGRVSESAEGFDNLIKLAPNAAPRLWERGIALYYAGRYKDCRAQFESHRTVNPNDVENAVWHFLCVARLESPERAKALLLPVGPDSRVPMREVYDMFKGVKRPEEVLAAAGRQASGQFYANLYIGLYNEALGNAALARQYITAAAADQFAAAGGYMHTVAKVHLGILQSQKK